MNQPSEPPGPAAKALTESSVRPSPYPPVSRPEDSVSVSFPPNSPFFLSMDAHEVDYDDASRDSGKESKDCVLGMRNCGCFVRRQFGLVPVFLRSVFALFWLSMLGTGPGPIRTVLPM